MTKDQEIQVEMTAFIKRVEKMGVDTHFVLLSHEKDSDNSKSVHTYSTGGNPLEVIPFFTLSLKNVIQNIEEEDLFIEHAGELLVRSHTPIIAQAFVNFLKLLQNEPPTITLKSPE